MKKQNLFYPIIAVGIVVSGCSDKTLDTYVKDEYQQGALDASAARAEFAKEGGTLDITVTTANGWTAASDAAWLTLEPAAGTGNGSIKAAALPLTGEDRLAYVTIKSGDNSKTLAFKQSGSIPDTAYLKGNLLLAGSDVLVVNVYPDSAVTLTAASKGASYYIWFKDDAAFDTTPEPTLLVGPALNEETGSKTEHSYFVQGLNANGAGAASKMVKVKITRLTDMPLYVGAVIKGPTTNICNDSAYRSQYLDSVVITASEVPGATSYKWFDKETTTSTWGTTALKEVTMSNYPDSVLYGTRKNKFKDAKIDSILSFAVGAEGTKDYSVMAYNTFTTDGIRSNAYRVTRTPCEFTWNDSIESFVGTYTAAVKVVYYDTLGNQKNGDQDTITTYTLKVTKTNATTLRVVSTFGLAGLDTAVLSVKVNFADGSALAAAQRLSPVAGSSFNAAYTPCFITSTTRYPVPFDKGKDVDGALGKDASGKHTITLGGFMLYRGTSAGAYLANPTLPQQTIATSIGNAVWTKD